MPFEHAAAHNPTVYITKSIVAASPLSFRLGVDQLLST